MEAVKEAKESVEHTQGEDLRRVYVKLPTATMKVIEAAATLGNYESVEAFITEAATEKAVDFQQKVQSLLGQIGGGTARGRRPPAHRNGHAEQ